MQITPNMFNKHRIFFIKIWGYTKAVTLNANDFHHIPYSNIKEY